MNNSGKISVKKGCRLFAGGFSLLAIGACSLLQPAATPHPSFYSLDGLPGKTQPVAPISAPTLIVSPPHAAPGYDSQRIIYMREPHKLEYFAHSEWIDPPARMLAPLLVAAIEKTGAFRAVVLTPSTAAGELRLDTEIIRLQQEFKSQPGSQPSQVRFTLRAHLIDENTRRVVASREFDTAVPVSSETPYGGVVAANRAVQSTLENLAAFCAAASSLPRR